MTSIEYESMIKMEKEISRVHRLSLPLVIKKKGTALSISDGFFGKDFEFKDFGQLKVTGIDREGSVTFELSIPQQATLAETVLSPQGKNVESGVVLIGTGTAKSSSGNISRGTYDYYKRSFDEYYYAIHRLEGKEKKIHLGSLRAPSSLIRKIIRPIVQNMEPMAWFDRKMLLSHLEGASAKHGQRLKSVLDILVLEGYLERREAKQHGRIYEQYLKTTKILSIK